MEELKREKYALQIYKAEYESLRGQSEHNLNIIDEKLKIIQKLDEEKMETEKKNVELRQSFEKTKEQGDQLSFLVAELKKEIDSKNCLLESVESKYKADIAQLSNKINDLTQEKGDLLINYEEKQVQDLQNYNKHLTSLQDTIQKLEDTIKTMVADNAKLNETYKEEILGLNESSDKTQEEARIVIENLEKQIAHLKNEQENLQINYNKVGDEFEKLTGQYDADTNLLKDQVKDLKNKIHNFEIQLKDIESLKAIYEDSLNKNKELTEASDKIKIELDANEELIQSIKKTHVDEIQALENRIVILSEQLVNHEQNVHSVHELDQLKDHIQQLVKELDRVSVETVPIDHFEIFKLEKSEEINKIKEHYQKALEDISADKEKTQNKVDSLLKKLEDYHIILQDFKDSETQKKQLLQDLSAIKDKYEELCQKNNDLENTVAKFSQEQPSWKNEIDVFKVKNQEILNEHKETQIKMNDFYESLVKSKADVKNLESQNETKMQELKQLKEALYEKEIESSLESDKKDKEIEGLKSDIQGLANEQEKTQIKMNDLYEALVKANADVKNIKSQNEVKKQELKQLVEILQKKETELASQNDEKDKEIEGLKSEIHELLNMQNEIQISRNDIYETLVKAKADVKNIESQNEIKKEELKHLGEILFEKEIELAAQNDKKDKEIEGLKSEVENLKNQINNSESIISKTFQENCRFKVQIEDLNNSFSNMQIALDKLKDSEQQSKLELDKKDKIIIELSNKLNGKTEKIKDLEVLLDKPEDNVKKLDDVLSKAHQTIEVLERELAQINNSIGEKEIKFNQSHELKQKEYQDLLLKHEQSVDLLKFADEEMRKMKADILQLINVNQSLESFVKSFDETNKQLKQTIEDKENEIQIFKKSDPRFSIPRQNLKSHGLKTAENIKSSIPALKESTLQDQKYTKKQEKLSESQTLKESGTQQSWEKALPKRKSQIKGEKEDIKTKEGSTQKPKKSLFLANKPLHIEDIEETKSLTGDLMDYKAEIIDKESLIQFEAGFYQPHLTDSEKKESLALKISLSHENESKIRQIEEDFGEKEKQNQVEICLSEGNKAENSSPSTSQIQEKEEFGWIQVKGTDNSSNLHDIHKDNTYGAEKIANKFVVEEEKSRKKKKIKKNNGNNEESRIESESNTTDLEKSDLKSPNKFVPRLEKNDISLFKSQEWKKKKVEDIQKN